MLLPLCFSFETKPLMLFYYFCCLLSNVVSSIATRTVRHASLGEPHRNTGQVYVTVSMCCCFKKCE